jgi:hypothetical protein
VVITNQQKEDVGILPVTVLENRPAAVSAFPPQVAPEEFPTMQGTSSFNN